MSTRRWWLLAKFLEGAGMILVLVGLVLSMRLGLAENDSLASMRHEMLGLTVGGALFLAGYLLERRLGTR